jgi:hypothetical protein
LTFLRLFPPYTATFLANSLLNRFLKIHPAVLLS